MKTRITLPLLLICLASSAQTYHPMLGNNVVWKVWYSAAFSGATGIEEYSTSNDTTIGGFTYTKILYGGVNGPYTTFMREDSATRKVYAIVQSSDSSGNPQGDDRLIYDFSLNLNDSIYLVWINGFFGPSYLNGYYKVDSVATVSTLAGPRKYMRLRDGNLERNWIEGVGELNSYVNYPQNYCDLNDCFVGYATFCQTRNGVETYERSPFYSCDSGLLYNCVANITSAHLDSNYTFFAQINGFGPYTYRWELVYADSFPRQVLDSSFYPSANFILLHGLRYFVNLTVSDTTGCNSSDYLFVQDTMPVNTNACNAFFWIYPDTIPGNYLAVNHSTGTNLSYLWDFGDGNTSTQQYPSHQYATPNRYTVCLAVDDGNGCTSTYCDSSFYNINKAGGGPMSALNVVHEGTTGISKPEEARIILFPNPAQDEVFIQIAPELLLKNARFTLYDLLGKEVITVAVNDRTFRLDVSSLSGGYYFYRLMNDAGIAGTGKVIAGR